MLYSSITTDTESDLQKADTQHLAIAAAAATVPPASGLIRNRDFN